MRLLRIFHNKCCGLLCINTQSVQFRKINSQLMRNLQNSNQNLQFEPFFTVMLYFCTVTAIVYFCPLSMFWSWWIPMPMVRPYRFSTLHRGTARLYTLPVDLFETVEAPKLGHNIGCIHSAHLPGVHWLHADVVITVLQPPVNQICQSSNGMENPETGGNSYRNCS